MIWARYVSLGNRVSKSMDPKEKKALECPFCRKSMNHVELDGRYGGKFGVSFCLECLGIWGSAKAILQIGPDSLQQLPVGRVSGGENMTSREMVTACPGCSHRLEETKLGKDAAALCFRFCRDCESFWFDGRNQLISFMVLLEGKRRELKKQESTRAGKRRKHKGEGVDFLNLRYPFSWDIFEK
ncbi:MAG: hypothetical protein C4520_06960 [Candidatus Abyssobacteria bacterium SURF_5]|uniref:Transcription factor zinc-finger domain-containing protein n=1 Tax=Abyssobacteria bacterium (strain SURF_5) TaxID=2093360 RepID=A0A3A4P536_ABYX5|nr:MAG: hypothetical protein C4520_06960 [Candidatus Abyssubacteria bacterium SURF_5]